VWSISGGTFIGDPDDLINGQPASGCRIRWGGDSSGQLVVTASFTTPIDARSAAFLSPRLSTENLIPEGVKVEFAGKLASSPVVLGGNALGKRTVTHPNGATRRPAVFPAASIDELVLTIHDDKNGSPFAIHDGLYDLGELWWGAGSDWGVKQNLKIALQGGLLQRKSHENQNWPWAVKAYQAPSLNITPMTEEEAIGPRSDQDDFQKVMYPLAEDSTCVIIPTYLARNNATNRHAPPATIDASTISEQRLCRTFMIGNLDSAIELDGDDNEYFISPISFGESPP
jgi:hypothetical protein